jgi:hypothetical protein
MRLFSRKRTIPDVTVADILAAMDDGHEVTWHAIDDPAPGLPQLIAPIGPRGWYLARIRDVEFCIYSEGQS